jgi:ubiquinone/menaquinone biosynthesis C-methylase UbiE
LWEMGYYDFMAKMGVPYFHFGGLRATDRLAELCGIGSRSEILAVGCGTGYTACYLSERLGCRVVGIDISGEMIERAVERAESMGLTGRVEFRVGDANEMEFDDDGFDAVISEFVTIFLDKPRAFSEYFRVLRPGGYAGINELYKASEMPDDTKALIEEAEEGFARAVGLEFYLPTPAEYEGWFREAGFGDVLLEQVDYDYSYWEYVEAVGGLSNLTKMVGGSVYHILFNREMKDSFRDMGRIKELLVRNRKTKPYTGDVICVGRKPNSASS